MASSRLLSLARGAHRWQPLGAAASHAPFNKVIAKLFSSRVSWQTQSPYELLGVSTTASSEEIKIAYFKAAKSSHPDLNPGDAKAQDKFQRVAAAYELLKDPSRRRQFDAARWAGAGTSDRSQYQHQHQQQWYDTSARPQGGGFYDASDLFTQTMQDYTVIKEAAKDYVQDLGEEVQYGYDCLVRGDVRGVWEVVRVNSGLLVGVVLPLALLLRFPGLVAVVMGFGFRFALVGLMWVNRLPWAASWVWRRVVAMAAERVRRGARRGR